MFGKPEEKTYEDKPTKKEKPKPRFIKKYEQLVNCSLITIVVDSETGVNYIMTEGTFSELKGADGKTIIDPLPVQ